MGSTCVLCSAHRTGIYRPDGVQTGNARSFSCYHLPSGTCPGERILSDWRGAAHTQTRCGIPGSPISMDTSIHDSTLCSMDSACVVCILSSPLSWRSGTNFQCCLRGIAIAFPFLCITRGWCVLLAMPHERSKERVSRSVEAWRAHGRACSICPHLDYFNTSTPDSAYTLAHRHFSGIRTRFDLVFHAPESAFHTHRRCRIGSAGIIAW